MTTRDKKDDRAKTNSMFCLSAVFFGGGFFVFFFFCLMADAWKENLFTSMKGLNRVC